MLVCIIVICIFGGAIVCLVCRSRNMRGSIRSIQVDEEEGLIKVCFHVTIQGGIALLIVNSHQVSLFLQSPIYYFKTGNIHVLEKFTRFAEFSCA